MEGVTAPIRAAPTPTVPAEDVISFFSSAYDDIPAQSWSTDWDKADVADAQAGGDDVKHYTDMRFAAIDFGLGGLFTLMGSMIADVVDLDEISTGERREGMFGSIFRWVVKLGQSLALLAGGFLLYSTGLEPALGANQPEGTIFWLRFYDAFVPLVASAIAIVVIYRYPITEQSALEVRAELERRRGT